MMELLSKAPQKGMMYALYVDKMIYQPYNSLDEISDEGLLELHLFDKKEEYRFIKARKKDIEVIINDTKIPHEDTYEEVIFTEKGKIKVVNYISYDENDLLTIQNYRLEEV